MITIDLTVFNRFDIGEGVLMNFKKKSKKVMRRRLDEKIQTLYLRLATHNLN